MSLVNHVRNAGVVGAGGGGFPAHVKLAAKADTIIANGAECEPLLHKDAAVLQHHAKEVVAGILLAADALGAADVVIAIKEKKKRAVEAATAACQGTRARIHLLGDYYPAGDEYDLVHAVTGRLIPPTGIPLHVGVVVQNVESLVNVAAAAAGHPVIRKFITIAGAVARPASFEVPIGISLRECIAAAGGATVADPVLAIGGMMMGETTADLDRPVTKTTAGAIVLPADHPVVLRKLKPATQMAAIGKSACDQCRYCTEFCPRYLLGYAVEPHQVMRSLGFTATGAERFSEWAALCCSCGLCTLYACPESLYPKEACDDSKAVLRELDWKWTGTREVEVHPMVDGRRVPIKSLMRRLDIDGYDSPAPLAAEALTTTRAVLPLKQHAGAPAIARVKPGQTLAMGEVIAEPAADALGAILHAPFAATVEAVEATRIILTAR
ncbi:MAG: SLBB domain-containing protein [Akkermansiaceae bacterium]|nr:SLBB domain-containing protein [Akkermansiaceae bacterium]